MIKKYKEMYSISEERLNEIFNNFKKKKILIIGDTMLDNYIWGEVERISPEAPVPVVKVIKRNSVLGGAANVARNIKSLGAEAKLLSVVGNDHNKNELIDLMKKNSLTTDYLIVDKKRLTTKKTRIIARNQQVVRVDYEDEFEIDSKIENKIISVVKKQIKDIDGIIISDYGKGVITKGLLDNIIKIANENRVFISVDPKDKHFMNYKNVNLITPNHHEAGRAYGKKITDENILIEVGKGLQEKLSCQNLLITRGENGMTLFTEDGNYYHFPTVALEVYDVTGAGDTVISTFTLAIVSGATLQEAAWISNHAASIVIKEIGTHSVSPEELFEVLRIEYLNIHDSN